MERASLHPLPALPPGSVSGSAAVEHLARALPALQPEESDALALVELAGRPRDEVAEELGLDPAAVGAALARARKAVRRSLVALPAAGWCERAERLISDRLDGALEGSGLARLEAHLGNCDRCVEHERALARARDMLVRDFVLAHRQTALPPGGASPAGFGSGPPLRVVEAPPSEAEPGGHGGTAAAFTVLLVLGTAIVIAAVVLALHGVAGPGRLF